jgi:hypothetical protein
MKIRPEGAELLHVDGRTADRHDETNNRFSQILQTRLKMDLWERVGVSLELLHVVNRPVWVFCLSDRKSTGLLQTEYSLES